MTDHPAQLTVVDDPTLPNGFRRLRGPATLVVGAIGDGWTLDFSGPLFRLTEAVPSFMPRVVIGGEVGIAWRVALLTHDASGLTIQRWWQPEGHRQMVLNDHVVPPEQRAQLSKRTERIFKAAAATGRPVETGRIRSRRSLLARMSQGDRQYRQYHPSDPPTQADIAPATGLSVRRFQEKLGEYHLDWNDWLRRRGW